MRRKKSLLIISVAVLVTVLFILPLVGFGILKWGVLPPEKLTPLVIEQTNRFIDAHLECEHVELTFWETYPNLGVKLTNGRLISHAADDDHLHIGVENLHSDSLLFFNQVTLSLRPFDYLFRKIISIDEILIDGLHFYGYVNREGKANWAIYQTEEGESVEVDAPKEPLPTIDLKRVHITNAHFIYDDEQQDTYMEMDDFFLMLTGSFTGGGNQFEIETGSSSFLYTNPSYSLTNRLNWELKSRVEMSHNFSVATLTRAEMRINKLPFTANGVVFAMPESNNIRFDVNLGLGATDINELLAFIPGDYLPNRHRMEAKGSVMLDASVNGVLGDSIMPSVYLYCRIADGAYHMKDVEQGIENLSMDMDVFVDGVSPESSYLNLGSLVLEGLNTSLHVEGNVSNLLNTPSVDMQMKGRIDFTRLGEEFLNPDTFLIRGVADMDLGASFTSEDIINSRFDKIRAKGRLDIDTFKVFSKPLDIDMLIADAHLVVGAVERESRYLNVKDMLNAKLTVDSLNIRYKDEIDTRVGKVELEANTAQVIDTTAVIPVTGQLKFEHLRTRMPDSVWVSVRQALVQGGLKASENNKRQPVAAMKISVDTLKYFVAPTRTTATLAESVFRLEALPYRDAMRQQQATRRASRQANGTQTDSIHPSNRSVQRDSLRMQAFRARRDSTGRVRRESTTGSETNQLLRNWEARGSVQFKQMRVFSRLFPTVIRMGNTSVNFDTNKVTMTDARVRVGKSDFTLSGELSRIRQAMLRGGTLQGEFYLTSDTIDCNQLMQAINRGMLFAEQLESAENQLLNSDEVIDEDEQLAQHQEIDVIDADTTDVLFVVPRNLNMTLHTKAKRVNYTDLNLENVEGKIIIRDQSLNLSNLSMKSNIGNGNLTMVYTAKDRQGATAGFDLEMEQILVDKLIGLFPSIDTLVPMLRSFEGMVDCQITATCDIDSTMSMILPSLQSACYLYGKNMVLLDGETFTEISKTLMFKNKERNQIDSISVDLAIRDHKIEVFPFLLEMDRYRVAVGGTHNLDMTFNYHVSVLKSPVPFKLGIDVTGNMDDFKYKIVKCKYKDTFKPARSADLNDSRVSLRQEIRNAIREKIKETAPELVSFRQQEPANEESTIPAEVEVRGNEESTS
ncbi:AsmA-like C-terminal region-containing protein [Parabacteroides sp. PF5-9]|uniref:AsmA-like C-terminal region-containing protein n=1 Tax=Parabacteroides sp. PF5-9 TaxID=1742404 RepID=UPI0024770E3C|nr:AsmA-like C-terminal region-containing protein [Parabacteroides sp. PF5-9]MDH6357594.1 hypothetical protein [Parabacteroides sp. PF5-9]